MSKSELCPLCGGGTLWVDDRGTAHCNFCSWSKAKESSVDLGTGVREFGTGATRDTAAGKPDYEGFLSPLVIRAFGEYMLKHQDTAAGGRSSDNWQKGIPKDVYIKSAWRHFFDWWSEHRHCGSREGLVDAICGLLFNLQGYLHEYLKEQAKEQP